jgi:hypothetical protein
MLTATDRRKKYTLIEDLRKRRMENLKLLVALHGTARALSRKIGCSESLLCHIVAGRRNIGEVLARDWEKQLQLPEGSLDQAH